VDYLLYSFYVSVGAISDIPSITLTCDTACEAMLTLYVPRTRVASVKHHKGMKRACQPLPRTISNPSVIAATFALVWLTRSAMVFLIKFCRLAARAAAIILPPYRRLGLPLANTATAAASEVSSLPLLTSRDIANAVRLMQEGEILGGTAPPATVDAALPNVDV